MGLMDGLLGGVVGATATHLISGYIERNGGLQGVVQQFEKSGMGNVVQSWIGKGANLPISVEQLHQVLGNEAVQSLAAKTGLSVPELLQKLSQVLPATVDGMTPDGVIPKA
jgi:uncharacterized protein YidB (DUF937 family)